MSGWQKLLGFSDDVDSLAVGTRVYKVMTLRKLPSLTATPVPERLKQLEAGGWPMCTTYMTVVFQYANSVLIGFRATMARSGADLPWHVLVQLFVHDFI